ncbi:hypothetical protein BDP27DRAFT_1319519 [Rhodocollybia butyracea]|uniref:F-box domain-containing protein n=1 Tax=Rhodocollybia butyracea TaxID=206335 RepID=A0A9P5PUV7_9AGAR|nr:hypothetical protein BDP27DRAFT_1319519 [Rhodocollybia butyracea]
MDQRLSSLLSCNDAPSQEETDAILEHYSVTDMTDELARLNSQIACLQSSLEAITAKRDGVQEKLDVYRAALSPIRRCPTEILQQIFVATIDAFPVLSYGQGPPLLGRVCSRWRAISWATSELWSAVHVTIPEALHTFQDYDRKCERLRASLSAWLTRAGTLPLYISMFSKNENTYREDVQQVTQMLRVLVPYSKQWRYLSLQIPASSLNVLAELQGVDVPLLETALIACSDTNPFVLENTSRHPSFLETAPGLQYLSLGDAGPMFRPVVPWSQLRFLSMDHNDWNFGAQELIEILAECSELKECMLAIHARTDLSHALNDPISLLHLEKLSLNTNCVIMTEVLDQLCLPRLTHLHLDGYRAELNPAVLNSLKGMLHRSKYPLTSLKLEVKRSVTLSTSALIDLLKSMPLLKGLVFAETSTQTPIIDEELLKALSNMVDVVCPHLEYISIPDRFTFSEQALETFVTTRLDPPPELTRLQTAVIVSYRNGLAERFSRFGERIRIIEDIPFRSLPSIGRPNSRYIEYSDEY